VPEPDTNKEDKPEPPVCVPTPEICDGKDNDCNGQIDDNLTAPYCSKSKGVCANARKRCGGTRGWLNCSDADYLKHDPAYQAKETKCDGKDNDCNGDLDPGCRCKDGDTQSCGQTGGVCQVGTQTCANGKWGKCSGIEPSAELCNNKDDDCDGSIDEDFPDKGQACSVGKGACEQSSTYICKNNGSGVRCPVNAGSPQAETCNGKDDDCDGQIDNNLTAVQLCSKRVGVCAGNKAQRCENGSWTPCGAREYGPDYEVDEKTCDGKDNDCDGTIDENVTTRWYADKDGDGYGDPNDFVDACQKPTNRRYVQRLDDCNDNNKDVHPGQTNYFSTPYRTSNGTSYDYDCNNREEKKHGESGRCPSGCNGNVYRFVDRNVRCGTRKQMMTTCFSQQQTCKYYWQWAVQECR
jgi:hypothetical protein